MGSPLLKQTRTGRFRSRISGSKKAKRTCENNWRDRQSYSLYSTDTLSFQREFQTVPPAGANPEAHHYGNSTRVSMICFKCGAKSTHSACLQCGQCQCDVCRRRYSGHTQGTHKLPPLPRQNLVAPDNQRVHKQPAIIVEANP